MSVYSYTLLCFTLLWSPCICQFGAEYPDECNAVAAIQCEYEFLQCRLFRGPADDPETMCACGNEFYGDCLRRAGCEFSVEFDKLGNNEIYQKKCVDHLLKYDCPNTLMCAVNCASERNIDQDASKIMPFNNYGSTYLRLRFCDRVVHPGRLKKYSVVVAVACSEISDFLTCTRWIPPLTFIPVALPSNTTYMEVDYCDVYEDGSRFCHVTDPPPARVYGSSVLFPSTFNVAQTNVSVCSTDDDCLGSFCDDTFRPRVCSPKTMFHVENSGRFYLTVPFG
mmetsp:Transcript_13803/g.20670  ORF Transcript_13803/g.20670 Transcript_13803/m.20670 type:complete len:280 (+) Transcript_13803:144-983(+)